MSGDYSRFGFDPSRNYSGVRLQQGRPLTDNDWNTSVAVTDRRIQAAALDTSAPVLVAPTTPDAFKITINGNRLMIGRGRIYVDGLLADNHGAGAQIWDAELAELFGKDLVAYDQQPYLPQPAALPTTGKSLIYLDVWEREVTHIQDSDLVEKAIGVDTTTRGQLVWQVKFLGPNDVPANVDCATPLNQIPAWTDFKPSGGRLTTDTGQFAVTDPCLIPPAGGYKGLENQLYRVEIQRGGPLGQATFKWSRENGSVTTRVSRIIDSAALAKNVLVVESIGKDDVLRFSDGDWVEITDDYLELNGLPGELRRIKTGGGVDDTARTITLETAPTATLFPTIDAQGNLDTRRNTRICRWDQTGTTGEITVPANGAQVVLENGILVSFGIDASGSTFHVGDYWVFAARASDASIEKLTAAPPRGIHHHRAKLAVYTPPGTIEDCRPKPHECCCSITVRPGDNIQSAINSLPVAGGCVCLKTGVHVIPQTLTISRSNVKLAAESHGTIIRANAPGAVLQIGNSPSGTIEGIEISMIAFEQLAPGPTPSGVVTVSRARRSALLDCEFKVRAPRSVAGVVAVNATALSATALNATAATAPVAPTAPATAAAASVARTATAASVAAVAAPAAVAATATAPAVTLGIANPANLLGMAVPIAPFTGFVAQSIGVQLAESEQIRIVRCRFELVAVGVFAAGNQTKDLILEDNTLDFGADTTRPSANFGVIIQGIATSCRFEGNTFRGVQSGIIVNGTLTGDPQPDADATIVTKNVVTCLAPPVDPGAGTLFFGIDLAGNSSIVSQNIVKVPGVTAAHTAIRVTGQNIEVIDNQVTAVNPSQTIRTAVASAPVTNPGNLTPVNGGAGIQVGYKAGDTTIPTSDVCVDGNVVDGCRIAIAAMAADDVIITNNMIDIVANVPATGNSGISLTDIRSGGQVRGNRIRGGGSAISCINGNATLISDNVMSNGNIGVMMSAEKGPAVSRNRIDRMAYRGVSCINMKGRCDIVGNRITSCGFNADVGIAIAADLVLGELHVESNEIMDTGNLADIATTVSVAYGIYGTQILEASIESNLVTYSAPNMRPPTGQDRALYMTCLFETTTNITLTANPVTTGTVATNPAIVAANIPIAAVQRPIDTNATISQAAVQRTVDPGATAAQAAGRPAAVNLAAGPAVQLNPVAVPTTGVAVGAANVLVVHGGYALQIFNNKFIGTGLNALVEVAQQVTNNVALRFERILFSNNYCHHLTGFNPDNAATVWMMGRSAIMMGNSIKATTNIASANFNGMPGPFIGNVTQGNVIGHPEFPSPQNNYNLIF
jgi:Family of unknown function (DUF6519)/Periplasmic copper-binding protein (NosD)